MNTNVSVTLYRRVTVIEALQRNSQNADSIDAMLQHIINTAPKSFPHNFKKVAPSCVSNTKRLGNK